MGASSDNHAKWARPRPVFEIRRDPCSPRPRKLSAAGAGGSVLPLVATHPTPVHTLLFPHPCAAVIWPFLDGSIRAKGTSVGKLQGRAPVAWLGLAAACPDTHSPRCLCSGSGASWCVHPRGRWTRHPRTLSRSYKQPPAHTHPCLPFPSPLSSPPHAL